jgi:hypothetical protein
MKVVAIIMKVAPVGLGCYFAATMASQDASLLMTFARAIILFMVATVLYYIFGSILYSWLGRPARCQSVLAKRHRSVGYGSRHLLFSGNLACYSSRGKSDGH